jgi:hypothetical protein
MPHTHFVATRCGVTQALVARPPVLPHLSRVAIKEPQCHLSDPLTDPFSLRYATATAPLFPSPWLTGDSLPHHRFSLVSRSKRGSPVRCNSRNQPHPLLSTGVMPRRSHAAAKPPSSVNCYTGCSPSPFWCCGAILTPSRTRRSTRSYHQSPHQHCPLLHQHRPLLIVGVCDLAGTVIFVPHTTSRLFLVLRSATYTNYKLTDSKWWSDSCALRHARRLCHDSYDCGFHSP